MEDINQRRDINQEEEEVKECCVVDKDTPSRQPSSPSTEPTNNTVDIFDHFPQHQVKQKQHQVETLYHHSRIQKY